jgi:hypothetical protein
VPRADERKVVLVTRRSRFEDLLARFNTRDQARFYVEHLGADFDDYMIEHENYQEARRIVVQTLEKHGRYQLIDRAYLPNFLFGPRDVVLALGQDGVVANTLKYLDGQPLAGINPDPALLEDRAPLREVTMGEARFADGQTLYAVNDFFVGPKTHTSARYEIRLGEQHEVQSSSGIIVSTGMGSTGWMRSVLTGAHAVAAGSQAGSRWQFSSRAWNEKVLQFAVREPFPSKSSAATLIHGQVSAREPLIIVSQMAENGVVFSDGIEADFLAFNAGMMVEIRVADRVGRLVC